MKAILWTRKIIVPTFLALVFSTIMVSVGTASATPAVTQTNPTTIVFLDPAIINGTEIGVGNTVTVNINISDAVDIYGWQAGLIFNATLLECTGFFEGEFLSDVGSTYWIPATINNTAGVIDAHGSTFLGDYKASDSGRLAYLTFEVKAPGVSDLHFRDVMVMDYDNPLLMVPFNIIDVYTVVEDTTPHTVVTVSNSTGLEKVWDPEAFEYIWMHSGLYNHNFSMRDQELSFNVTAAPHARARPFWSFSNVTVPKTLLEPEPLHVWAVIIDGSPLSVYEITITENASYTSIYFTYPLGDHKVQITTRFIPSTISMTPSKESVAVGSTITLSGEITPVRANVNVTIEYRESGAATWTTLATVTTDSNGNYTYSWETEETGTYEVRAGWEGDETYFGAASEPVTVKVKEKGIPLEIIAAAVGAIAIIVIVIVIVVYFVKVRKDKPE